VLKEPQVEVTTIFGSKDPLSNHFPCTVHVMGHSFPSAEQAYLHTKALNSTNPELADKIKQSGTASEAKRLARDIPFNPNWLPRRETVMEEVLRAKLVQVPAFSEALLQSADNVLVGAAAGDYHWGSGLSETHTKITKQARWPGKNLLGTLQMKLREETQKTEDTSKKENNKETYRKTHNLRSLSVRDPPETGNKFAPLQNSLTDNGPGDIDMPRGGYSSS
jgi:ribA/ribD-fused uncharacterized protein